MFRIASMFWLFWAFTVFPLEAQNLFFERFSKAEGLASEKNTCLLQDRQGFFWFGSQSGLSRFDGYSFKVFKHDPGDPNSLSGDYIRTLYEDRAGYLWVGTESGLSRYDSRTERFVSYCPDPANPNAINTTFPKSVYEDANGSFWIVTWNGGLQQLDRNTGHFQSFFPTPEMKRRSLDLFTSAIYPDRHRPDHFWIAMTLDGSWQMYSFNTVDKTFTPCPSDSFPKMVYFFDVFEGKNGVLWFVNSAGLTPFDPQAKRFLSLDDFPEVYRTLGKLGVTKYSVKSASEIWLATGQSGLVLFDRVQEKIVRRYRNDPGSPGSLINNRINGVLQDRSGILWISTPESGIAKAYERKLQFGHNRPDTSIAELNVQNAITAICETQSGQIWLGSEYRGIYLFDPATRQFRRAETQFPELAFTKDYYIYSLLESAGGDLWIGLNSHGLARFNPKQRSLKTYVNSPEDPGSLIADHPQALLEDRAGELWVGTLAGLEHFDRTTDHFEHHLPVAGSAMPDHPGNKISSLYEDAHGNLWVGTQQCLFLRNPKNGSFIPFLKSGETGTARVLSVNCVRADRENTLWVGTGYGLYRLKFPNPANPFEGEPLVRRYTEKDGLPNQHICAMAEDAKGRLWLSTYAGISLFRNPGHDAQTLADFNNYGMQHGLQWNQFSENAVLKSRSGAFIFSGINGLNLFFPDSIRDNSYRAPVVFTAFEKLDVDQEAASFIGEEGISERDRIEVSYKHEVFAIEFAALDYREPQRNRYAYRMIGFNDNWVQLGNLHRVSFTSLAPGTYTLEVRGSNSDGIWNETPARLTVVITPPWWKTLWAYTVYVLLFVASLRAFVRFRTRYLENRNRELEKAVTAGTVRIREQNAQLEIQADELKELDRLKSRLYANITHELRTPLTLMLGPLNAVLKNRQLTEQDFNLLKMVRQNGRKLLHLITDILDLSRLDANKAGLRETPVGPCPLLQRLLAHFESHAAYLQVSLISNCDLPSRTLLMLDEKKFETIVNNLISNALKFTPPGGTVTVDLRESGNSLLLSVRDNGRGIHPEDLPHIFDRYFQTKRAEAPVEGGSGIGLALCAELVRIMAGQIRVESTPGVGSVFYVQLPQKSVTGQDTSERATPEESNFPVPEHDLVSPAIPRPDLPPGSESPEAGQVPAILIVEDNPDLQQYLRYLLSPLYDIVMAGDGEEALEKLRDDAPDRIRLIVSDVMMPRMDGFQLLETLKSDDRFRHIPVVMLTARADFQDKLRALRIGVDDYLTKPFEEEELLARVHNLLQRQQNRRDTREEDDGPVPRLSQADAEWLTRLEDWTAANLQNYLLDVGAMAGFMALSERQLLRRLKEIAGVSPQKYITEMRLQKARDLLERGAFRSVAEVAYAAGFNHPKVFSRDYRARFGKLPSAYF